MVWVWEAAELATVEREAVAREVEGSSSGGPVSAASKEPPEPPTTVETAELDGDKIWRLALEDAQIAAQGRFNIFEPDGRIMAREESLGAPRFKGEESLGGYFLHLCQRESFLDKDSQIVLEAHGFTHTQHAAQEPGRGLRR